MSQISIETLRALLDYNPETGALTWKPRSVSMFSDGWHSAAHNAAAWNARHAGRPAFTASVGAGYLQGCVFDRKHLAHRVAWAIFNGEWPVSQIDHINGNRADNRINNLRVVTNAENSRNQKRRDDNTSGVTGVHWDKNAGKWCARIMAGGRYKHLGYFGTLGAAAAARKAADLECGYHENHGRDHG